MVSKRPNDPMKHRLSNMNMFFSEAFEYAPYVLSSWFTDVRRNSIEEQHE